MNRQSAPTAPLALAPVRWAPELLPWLVCAGALAGCCWRAISNLLSTGSSDNLMLLATVGAVLWMERSALAAALSPGGRGRPWLGSLLFAAGALAHVVGRLSDSTPVEVWGLFLLPAGLVAALAPRSQGRAVVFLACAGSFVVVIGRLAPAVLSSGLAGTLAAGSAALLSATLLPVAAEGVHLYFGPYSAEVTAACSGMNSIFALTALAMLYLREGAQRKGWQIALLAVCVIPVAVLTNFVRILLLVLSTQYVGDRFAQGLFHETAGVFAFLVALGLLVAIDGLLRRVAALTAGGGTGVGTGADHGRR